MNILRWLIWPTMLYFDAGVGEAAAAEGAKGAGEAAAAETADTAVATGIDASTGEFAGETASATTGAGTAAGAGEATVAGVDAGAANAGAAGPTGSQMLQVAKDAAPVVGVAASLVSSAGQVEAAKKAAAGLTPAVAPPLPQAAIDPDLTAIRKKNALLFGLDTPSATDITGGKAGTGNVGRATLLGGTSSLGS